jgi:hypothetical protein
MLGKSVLLVDLDPQAHLTCGLGIQAHELDYTVCEVLRGEISAAEAIVKRGKLEILPASLSLSAAGIELSGTAGREFLLKEVLAEHCGFEAQACPPYWPRAKGKVERAIEYIQTSFLEGRALGDLDDLNEQLRT